MLDVSQIQAIIELYIVNNSGWTNRGYFSAYRGLYLTEESIYNHKWKENNIEYPFCIKCGTLRKDSFVHSCIASTESYYTVPRLRHNFKKICVKSVYEFPVTITLCTKCGLLPEKEWIYYRIDNSTGKPQICKKARNAKRKRIPCCLTDDEFIVKDLIL